MGRTRGIIQFESVRMRIWVKYLSLQRFSTGIGQGKSKPEHWAPPGKCQRGATERDSLGVPKLSQDWPNPLQPNNSHCHQRRLCTGVWWLEQASSIPNWTSELHGIPFIPSESQIPPTPQQIKQPTFHQYVSPKFGHIPILRQITQNQLQTCFLSPVQLIRQNLNN